MPKISGSGTGDAGKGGGEVGGSGILGRLIGEGEERSDDPKWQTLERKEARLRKDQLTDLADLRRYLSSRRRDRSEIITDNTLIRVAVDLLLKGHAHRLHGDTEEDLLRSVLPRRRAVAVQQEEASSEMAEQN
ncbi:hypothetical protein [Streptomyces ipomoeae]|uniref:hypothetical protein n=1 Tax=Streptomyces ipomoeae TaxID=103232 RepID=UPI0029B1CEB9|nr:hypothetical protein [Streptomyces ipomoeae]MDX2692168.1 hypothetical protein [Streptomyces ipomoeae]MDX2840499.1 hypothetical protein [Streptomyces ipomoeae]